MPKYIDISTKNIPPLTFNRELNTTTIAGNASATGTIITGAGISMNETPVYLRTATNTDNVVKYDAPINGVSIQGYNGGKMGTTGGVSNVIGWNTNSATITGALNVSGTTTLTGNLIAGATTITNVSLGYVSGATMNLQTQLNRLSIYATNLTSLTTGIENVVLGSSNYQSLTTGNYNIGMGRETLNQLVSGSHNIAIGFQSGGGLTTSSDNIFIGRNAGISGAFSSSAAIGQNAVITATNQIALGTNVSTVKIPGAIDISGATTLTGPLICNQIYETALATTGTTSPFTCNMALGSTFYIPTDYTFASNFQIIVTNVPTDTTKTYTISVIYRQPTTLFYISTARVSDTATTYILGTASTFSAPLFNGGLPVLANTPNLIIQSFSIISTATSTPTFTRYVTSSVNNHY